MKLSRHVAAIGLMLMASPVLACVCPAVLPESAVPRAQAVFTGKVIRSGKSTWIVEVDRVWKGEVESQIESFDAHAGSSCSTRGFKKGQSYLFLVNVENKDGKIRYSPDPCNWTMPMRRSKMIVKENRIIFEDGEGAMWAEEFVLKGHGEGKPPLTRSR